MEAEERLDRRVAGRTRRPGRATAASPRSSSPRRGAVGYVDLSDAKASGLKVASIKNLGGKFVEPTTAAASAAGDGIDVKPTLLFSALNAKGDKAYPITCQTWVIVYAKQADKAKSDALKSYLKFLVGAGQKLLGEIDYAPLPKGPAGEALKQLEKITVK